MEIQLLNTETQTAAINVDGIQLILTNKRLFFNERFIGLNELRAADVSVVDLTFNKFQVLDYQTVRVWCMIILTMIFFFWMQHGIHAYTIGGYTLSLLFGVGMGMVLGSVLAILILLVLRIYIGATSKVEKRALLKIEKIDDTYFINNHCDISNLDTLKKFTNEINSLIYK
jgi:hypothetical protein